MLDSRIIQSFRSIVGRGNVLFDLEHLHTYRCDAASIFVGRPELIVLPSSTEQVSEIVKICSRERIPFVARGTGTGLSGGAVPLKGGVIIETSRMNRIIEVDYENQRAVVEAGLINVHLSEALAQRGYCYIPDPSSQIACTIGGNVAHNSGGPHCLKYGVTTNHIMGLEVVLPNGDIVNVGGKALDPLGYDLTGIFVGSEGTFGIVTKAVVRIARKPEAASTILAAYDSLDEACRTVSHIIAAGILPAAVEIMDKLAIAAVEASIHACGYPRDVEAVLIVEVDGLKEGLPRLVERITRLCKENHAKFVRLAESEEERVRFWKGRKGAFAAMGSVSPNYIVQDGVVPRTKLPEIMQTIAAISRKYSLRIANVFHAGDGNLHPLVLFDERHAGERERALAASEEILEACIKLGGALTGEHGIGVEKRDMMSAAYSDADLEAMRKLREVFDPQGLSNPGKTLSPA